MNSSHQEKPTWKKEGCGKEREGGWETLMGQEESESCEAMQGVQVL